MQYFQNICLYDSKINGFRDFLKSNILSFSIPLYSITVYIDTKKVVLTIVITSRNWIFYFLVFSLHITPINSIAKC